MNTFVKRALLGTLLAGGITLVGAAVANAAETTGDAGAASGSQAVISIDTPISLADNAVSLTGGSQGATTSQAPVVPVVSTSGTSGLGSSTQALIGLDSPVTVSGNAVSATGTESAIGTRVSSPDAAAPAPSATSTTSGSLSLGGGTQVAAPLTAPITVDGNTVSLLGDSDGSSSAPRGTTAPALGTATTGGSGGIAAGTKAAPLTVPITVDSNTVSLLGDSDGSSSALRGTTAPALGIATTGGSGGIAGGTQVVAPITAPVTIDGNTVSLLGDRDGSSSAPRGTTAPSLGIATTGGSDGSASGTQVVAPITAPITIDGNTVSLLGDTDGGAPSGRVAVPARPGAGTTVAGGLHGGAQAGARMALPTTTGGVTASPTGRATAHATGANSGSSAGLDAGLGTRLGARAMTRPGTATQLGSNAQLGTGTGARTGTAPTCSATQPTVKGALAQSGGDLPFGPAAGGLALVLMGSTAAFLRRRAV